MCPAVCHVVRHALIFLFMQHLHVDGCDDEYSFLDDMMIEYDKCVLQKEERVMFDVDDMLSEKEDLFIVDINDKEGNLFISIANEPMGERKRILVESLSLVMPMPIPNVFIPYLEHRVMLMGCVYEEMKHAELNRRADECSKYIYSWALQCYDFLHRNERLIKDWARDTNPWKFFSHRNPAASPIYVVLVSIITSNRLKGSFEHQRSSENWEWCKNALSMSFLCCGWGDMATLLLSTRVQHSVQSIIHCGGEAMSLLRRLLREPTSSSDQRFLDLFDAASSRGSNDPLSVTQGIPFPKDELSGCSFDDIFVTVSDSWARRNARHDPLVYLSTLSHVLPDMMKVGSDLLRLHGILSNHMRAIRCAAIICPSERHTSPCVTPETVGDMDRERGKMCHITHRYLLLGLSELSTVHQFIRTVLNSYSEDAIVSHSGDVNITSFLETACVGVLRSDRMANRIILRHLEGDLSSDSGKRKRD
jgi:hypothetical protein